MENETNNPIEQREEDLNNGNNSNSFFNSAGSVIWDIAKIVIISLFLVLFIRGFVIQPFKVSGSSMEPTYSDKDYLVVNEIGYRFSDPKRGDVVVFRFPGDRSQFLIKRVIGLPGEKIQIHNGIITVEPDGNELEKLILDENYIPNNVRTDGELNITLDGDQYFVLGDNRESSSDSRFWGPLRRNFIVGKVWLRLLPVEEMSVFLSPQY